MNKPGNNARIVIVDDDEDDFIITSDYIRSIPDSNHKIEWCPRYKDAVKRLLENKDDMFFVDYRLGAKSGVDFLKEARENECNSPIVLLTGKGNYTVDLQAMELGAVDYLVKTELSAEKMERCIRYALDRAATLQALRANERKYRNIFEKSKDLVFVADSQLNFVDVNEAVLALCGFEQQEIIGTNLNDLISYESQSQNIIAELLHSQHEVNDREVLLKTKEGEKKYCTLSLTLEDSEHEGGYVQGIIHDITSLKKVEKANLQGEKLAAAGRLVRTIAHEVRNPLNNITLSIEQMMQEITDEGMLLYMNIIQRNSKRINDLITELLYTSRPAEHKLDPQVLESIVGDVIGICADRLTLKRITLRYNTTNTQWQILADYEKLKLALLNIFINAIEALEESTGVLEVTMDRRDELIQLTIADNGCGISEEHISRLFEPYFTQKRNGVGLGLTFTLNILQAHKASIDVSSKVGVGTKFTIGFPVWEPASLGD